MIDLYAQLGLSGPVPDHILSRAIDRVGLDPTIRDAAVFILKNPGRRRHYDAAWRMLRLSAALRHEMRLDGTVLWERTPKPVGLGERVQGETVDLPILTG
jgi:hypothetical protein